MPANATLTATQTADRQPVVIRAYFQEVGDGSTTSSYFGYVHSYCKRLVLQSGINPSYALCDIPLTNTDDTPPAVTGVNSGPLSKIRQGTPAYIEMVYGSVTVKILTGYVVDVQQDLDHDSLSVEIADARYLLQAIPILGSWWMSGDSYKYRQGWAARCNPNGQPNMIHRNVGAAGLVPVFCTPNWGLAPGDSPEDPNAGSIVKASDWTVPKMLEYIWWHVSSTAFNVSPISLRFPWLAYNPSSIDWPETYAQLVESDFPEANSRKAPETVLKGDNCLCVIQDLLNSVGPLAITLGPKINANSDKTESAMASVGVVRTRYRGGGITVNRAAGGAASTVFAKSKVCTGGSIGESGKTLYTKFASAGQLVWIERRISSAASEGLLAAWSSTDETAWEDKVKADLAASVALATAIKNANKKYPNVFAAFKLDETYDFQAGTTQSSYSRADVGRPILGELLTSYLENTTAGQTTKRRFKVPVYLEYKRGSSFLLCTEGDGLTLDADGTFWVSRLREIASASAAGEVNATETYSFAATPTSSSVSAAANVMRLTVAIPCDHRLTASTKLPSDATSNMTTPTATDFDDNDRIDKNLSRLYYSESELEGLEIRKTSWPTPESVRASTVASDTTLRDDSSALQDRANARRTDKGRLEKTCQLTFPFLSPVWQPGIAIKQLDNVGLTNSTYFMGRQVTRVRYETSKKSQRMIVEAE